MNYKDFRILFMGTPEFAVPSMMALVDAGFAVIGVVTTPDKPAGRGQKLTPSPVKQAAMKLNLPVLQPTNLKDPVFLEQIQALNPDLGVVVAFRMLPQSVWSCPRLGSINLHASLLPDFRGAAPIQRAIMAGVTETGLTTFFLQHEIDTGAIIDQLKVPVPNDMTGGELYNLLQSVGAALLVQSVRTIADGIVKPIPQITTGTERLAPKIFPKDCRIDWSKPVKDVFNLIRALNPVPGADAIIAGVPTKILATQISSNTENQAVGTIIYPNKTTMAVRCYDGWLEILQLKPQNRKLLSVSDYLNGLKIRPTHVE